MESVITDHSLVESIDLSENHIATIIGKTRQAINNGLNGKSPHYFKDHELSSLYLYCRVNDKSSAAKVRNHILLTRRSSAESILSSNGLFLTQTELETGRKVIAIIPDFRYFMIEHPQNSKLFIERARRDPGTFLIATVSKADSDEFWSTVFPKNSSLDQYQSFPNPIINAMPYCVFIDHDNLGGGSCWVHGTGGFQLHDKMRAYGMYKFLTDHMPEPLKMMPSSKSSNGLISAQR